MKLMAGRTKRYLSQDEIDLIKKLVANQARQTDIAKAIGISVSSLKTYMRELRQKGIIGDEPTSEPQAKEDKEKQDDLVKPTKIKFLATAARTLSDDMVFDLKERLTAAQVLKRAELLYRPNIEAMHFNWQEWVERALRVAYEETTEWYENEGKKMSIAELMEIATEIETAKAFVGGMK